MFQESYYLIVKDLREDFSNKSNVFSVLLYACSVSYLVYFLMKTQGALVHLEVKYWNVLYWIILLFSIIGHIQGQLLKENRGRYLYYYTLVRPESFIVSKILYQSLFGVLVAGVIYLLFVVWFGNPIENSALFLATVVAGSVGFSAIYTLTTAISMQVKQNSMLSALLGFPMTIPVIVYTAKLCRESFSATPSEHWLSILLILVGFNLLLIFLSVILYPYIWQD